MMNNIEDHQKQPISRQHSLGIFGVANAAPIAAMLMPA